MTDIPFFVDVHCHPTLRAYNTPFPGRRNIWEETYNLDYNNSVSRWVKMKSHEIAKQSQANFYNLAEGNFRVIFDSLYPVEKNFLQFSRIPSLIMNKKARDQALITASGIDPLRLKHLRQNNDYFAELLAQYAFLVKGQGPSPDGKYRYQIASDYAHLQKIAAEDPNCIAIVPTIEGAHAFGVGTSATEDIPAPELKAMLTENIQTVKNWRFPPLFVNLTHHFWNQLAGHDRSFKPVINTVFNQNKGMGGGITDLGWHVLRQMLTRSNGRRILVDVKHMSLQSRMEFYHFVRMHNFVNPEDKIPVVCSHAGVNGYKTMEDSTRKVSSQGKKPKRSYFNTWTINLSNEEICLIHDSGGIAGIMMDKALLGGPATIQKITAIEDKQMQKEAFLRLILDNIFQMIKAVGKKSAWDILTLGTDYDGLIMHVDAYPDAASARNLYKDLIYYLESREYQRELWFGYEPREMITKLMQTNAMDFLKRNFIKHPSEKSSEHHNLVHFQ